MDWNWAQTATPQEIMDIHIGTPPQSRSPHLKELTQEQQDALWALVIPDGQVVDPTDPVKM